ncbi:MBL fold metallo-hydrolase [Clostridiaceae bacterium OttesenSCG-928-D20]|nr:MBL fold metallo-hydrolase [Clostridiaceae bacterium OttesenSCG-928-D20]
MKQSKQARAKIAILIVAVLAILAVFPTFFDDDSNAPSGVALTPGADSLEIVFIDVGQADSIFLSCKGEHMLIDSGNIADSDLIFAFLEERGIESLKYVINTHPHEDHVGGLPAAFKAAAVETVYSGVEDSTLVPFKNLKKAAEKQGLSITVPEMGSKITLGSAELTFLSPLREHEILNNMSLVIRLVHGKNSFLFTGDMERDEELDIINAGYDLDVDVLKLGHHGSSTSSSYIFLNEVMPTYGIISCGANNDYGHPHEEVLSKARDAEIKLFRTDMQGSVTCISNGEGLSFSTERNFDSVTNPKEQRDVLYIGNKRSMILHLPTCDGLPQGKNRVEFDNFSEGYKLGYTACYNCLK